MQVLKRPIITEKAAKLNEKRQYAFEVEIKSNKIEIRKAVEAQFGVDVISIRTIRMRPKNKLQFTRRGRFVGKTAARKKAYVTLKEGQTIDIGTGTNE
ncbi:MAG: 50S ribosomal protein L23 [Candidatus Kapaibacterium sp.]|nr:MAG: 50S ribosomal protein L23 [Candidatus Kapabacteria bacterium]